MHKIRIGKCLNTNHLGNDSESDVRTYGYLNDSEMSLYYPKIQFGFKMSTF